MSIFFHSNKEQKGYIWQKIHRTYPTFKSGGDFFRTYLQQRITPDSVVLDAGCGSNGILGEFAHVPRQIIGVDVDKDLLNRNRMVHQKIVADLAHLPLDNASVDVVVSEFVLEHLKDPPSVFKELSRVLKPNGAFIFLTPNLFNPVMMTSKILPFTLHTFLRKALLKKDEKAHATYYRANTARALRRFGNEAGFIQQQIQYAGNPEYLGFCKPFVPAAIRFEQLLDNRLFAGLKMYLIGCFTKNRG